MDNKILEYKILTSNTADRLADDVMKHIENGWRPIGSHQIIEVHHQNRFRGQQHIDTIIQIEYSQTIIK
jgi:hypothetical protein